MTSVQSFGGLRSFRSSEKMHKPRSSKVVKPILKKLSSTSEKSSLDLDRSWDEQDEAFRYQNSAGVWDGGVEGAFYATNLNRASSTKDVSFAIGTDPVGRTSTSGTRFSSTHHSRSISGTSVATSGSGSGAGAGVVASSSVAPRSFVHPFQQIPRTATPPISYANSLASSYVDSRDYSPTITEDEDYSSTNYDLADPTTSRNSLNQSSSNNNNSSSMTNIQYRQQQLLQQIPTENLNTRSQPSLTSSPSTCRRPTLTTHRTTSYSEGPRSHPSSLRINTAAARSMTSTPAQSSRLANVSSQTDLTTVEVSTSGSPSHPPLQKFASPSSTVSSSISPVMRSSFEAVNFPRLRAKSDLDTATRQDHLREARRKFEAREQAKEEKYAREQIRRREREDNKRALEVEKQAKAQRKEREAALLRLEAAEMAEAALPHNKQHNRKSSGNSTGRPSMTRMRSGRTNTGGSQQQQQQQQQQPQPQDLEKFAAGNYESMSTCTPPAFGQRAGTARTASYEAPRRSHTAKRKTHGAWTAFILWLRTRLLRLKSKTQ